MGFLYPHISYYIYLPLWVVIMIVFIATAEWFTYVCRYLNSTETKFSFKVVNFISMTWHLLMISSLSLFFWYIYPELLLLNTVFWIVVICQWVVAAVNTLYLCLKDYDPIKNRIYFVYTSVLSLFYLWTSFMVIWQCAIS